MVCDLFPIDRLGFAFTLVPVNLKLNLLLPSALLVRGAAVGF
jgi:hypothetical protein